MEQTSNLQFALVLLEAMQSKPLTQEEKLLVVKKFVRDNKLSHQVLFVDELDNLENHTLQHLDVFLTMAVETLQSKLETLTQAKQRLSQAQTIKQSIETLANEENADTPGHTPITDTMEKKSAPSSSVTSQYPKGYSKNGIKLGRRPKNNTAASSLNESKVSASPPTQAEKKQTSLSVSKKNGHDFQSAIKRVDALKYGKEFPLDALYIVDNEYVRSNRLLAGDVGVRPMGVIVPYVHQDLHCELAVFYDDEKALIPLATARAYARQKIKPFGRHHWRIKSSMDNAYIKPHLDTINMMCKKMGGTEIKGSYYDGKDDYMNTHNSSNKIRYVCDIFSPNDAEK